jgi:hypothetical protein
MDQSEDLATAESAYLRHQPRFEALKDSELLPMNVDIVHAASITIGVAPRVMSHRDEIAELPRFDVSHVDNLVEYAKATWFAYITNAPPPAAPGLKALVNEATALRRRLLLWAEPLVEAGHFQQVAIDKVKEGQGYRDTAADISALAELYLSHWHVVENKCDLKSDDLSHARHVGQALFEVISRREFQAARWSAEGSARVRRAWTVLDRAYRQCRRAIEYLRFDEGDADKIIPSLRRNAGVPAKPKIEPVDVPPARSS